MFKEGEQLRERLPPMADAVLDRRIELSRGFAKLRQVEQRVVAKAIRAARRARDLAAPHAFGDEGTGICWMPEDDHDAGVERFSIVLQFTEQLLVVAPIAFLAVAVPSGVVRGMHPRRSAERLDTQAGIVGERRQAGSAARMPRFRER